VEVEVTRYGVDVGGTFTDVVALHEDGAVEVGKVRSTTGAVASGVWRALSVADGGTRALVHGTTVATNALLERSGSRVMLVTTQGFEDLLWLRRQDRAHLYDLSDEHPPPVVHPSDVIGAAERIAPDGVIVPLSTAEVDRVVERVREQAPEAVAVSFLFSFKDPSHERTMARALREALPDIPIAVASELLPVFREYERTGTVAAEAYLRPRVAGYLGAMEAEAASRGVSDLRVMASTGGTLTVAQAKSRAVALALSGPAGGVEGARLIGVELGLHDLLTIDMGGTSADASVILDGQPLTQTSGQVGGVPIALPHVLIETVGAGGGSIAWVDAGGALRVGPQSAGATPGPACYGQGGEQPTVTDAALVLGWLDSGRPLADALQLEPARAREAIARVARQAKLAPERCAEGIVEIATATMVRALRRVSVERGVDPRGTTLVAFGGAGPLFGCGLADAMGIARVLIPPHAGVLSALGLAAAPGRVEHVASLHRRADETTPTELDLAFGAIEAAAIKELPGADVTRYVDCRYPGQGYELMVAVPASGSLADAFHGLHAVRFGHADRGRPVELVNLRVVATRPAQAVQLGTRPLVGNVTPPGGRAVLEELAAGSQIVGPRMVDAADCTIRVEANWTGRVHSTGALVLERVDA